MKLSLIGSTLVGLALLLQPTPSLAASMRCGSHLIEDGGLHGPTMYEVIKKCGQPTQIMSYTYIYEISGRTYELRFSGAGILTTIRQNR
ncbi:MAG: DUF2845 domain-containing protein [Halieaceae bacterium]